MHKELISVRLHALSYTGSISIVKDFVHPLRPVRAGRRPVQRYETAPGTQLQFDWGEFTYEQAGQPRKLFGFTAVLSYSRMRFVIFVKRADTATLLHCLMKACEYFGGLTRTMLTDCMKSVLLEMDGRTPIWNPRFAEFMAAMGVAPRVCQPYTPQTKGNVERSIGVVKDSFWPGIHFTDLDDLNRQAWAWCDARNRRVHRTTRARPIERWRDEQLTPLPAAFAWERFATEDRKVSWDGYVSYDGVQYGVPCHPSRAPWCPRRAAGHGQRMEPGPVAAVRDEVTTFPCVCAASGPIPHRGCQQRRGHGRASRLAITCPSWWWRAAP